MTNSRENEGTWCIWCEQAEATVEGLCVDCWEDRNNL